MGKDISILLLWASILAGVAAIISTNNVCTFRTEGKLFSLTYLNAPTPYKIDDSDGPIYFNFCFAFVPPECPNEPSAFSFVVTAPEYDQNTNTITPVKCDRYSSNSTTTLFQTRYIKQQEEGILELVLLTEEPSLHATVKLTTITIRCSAFQGFEIEDSNVQLQRLQISGNSFSGCPVFQISSIWRVFENYQFLFGIVMFLLGFYLLFYGRSTIDITVFIAVMMISLATIGSLLTLFISPTSSTLVIYAAFIVLLFVSCLFGYMATKLINVSVFFVGAFLGFIIGILVSSMFSKIFDIYASWPIIIFVLLFSIPCGLLTFKYHDDVIIASSAFTGAYMVVRPISWIFGGFPNQFLLYKVVESAQIQTLPSTFFLYVLAMIILAVIGSMYQRLKLYRRNPEQQIQVNIIQKSIEGPIDAVKVHVDKLIQKFRDEPKPEESYHNFNQIQIKFVK